MAKFKHEETLEKNKSKNFVRRVLDPYIYPNLPNDNGSTSTHSMASGESDGKFYAYPTVVQQNGRDLTRLEDDKAFDYAMSTGEFIQFDTDEEAKDFAKGGYKVGWNKPSTNDIF